jgi:hypothetical protein
LSVPAVRQRKRRSIVENEREAFLNALREGYSVTHAAKPTGHARQRFYELREEDEAFAAAWQDAWEAGTDLLEDELRRRAMGYDEVTYDGEGKVLRRVHRYDTPAIVMALKARRPDVYRENVARVELTGRDGGPVELEAGYKPTTLADVVRLARELGIADDVIEGEAVEVAEIEERAS